MSTPITNIPQGFLSLLGLRDMGGVPREVTPLIAPGIDITSFLLLNREPIFGTGTFNAVGGTTFTQSVVPAGELWYVHWADVRTDGPVPAGATCKISVSSAQYGVGVQLGDPYSGVAGELVTSFTRDLWLTAGSDIRLRVHEVTGGPINCTVSALITRLRI